MHAWLRHVDAGGTSRILNESMTQGCRTMQDSEAVSGLDFQRYLALMMYRGFIKLPQQDVVARRQSEV